MVTDRVQVRLEPSDRGRPWFDPRQHVQVVGAPPEVSALSRVLIPVLGPTTSTEIVSQIIEEARTCPVDGCPPPPITVGQAAAIMLWVQDQRAHEDALVVLEDLMEINPGLISVGVVPPMPQPYWLTEPSVALARLAERGLADICPVTSQKFDEVLTRAGLAELIGKAFGYLPVVICGAVA